MHNWHKHIWQMFMAYVNRVCFVDVRKHVQQVGNWRYINFRIMCIAQKLPYSNYGTGHMHCDEGQIFVLVTKFSMHGQLWTSVFIVLVLRSDCGHLPIDLMPS